MLRQFTIIAPRKPLPLQHFRFLPQCLMCQVPQIDHVRYCSTEASNPVKSAKKIVQYKSKSGQVSAGGVLTPQKITLRLANASDRSAVVEAFLRMKRMSIFSVIHASTAMFKLGRMTQEGLGKPLSRETVLEFLSGVSAVLSDPKRYSLPDPRCISNICFGYGYLDVKHDALEVQLCQLIVDYVHLFSAMDMANIMSGLSKARVARKLCDPAFDAMMSRAIRSLKLTSFSNVELNMMLWGCARLEPPRVQDLHVIADTWVWRVFSMKPRDVANVARAMAVAGFGKALLRMSPKTLLELKEFGDVAGLLWALAQQSQGFYASPQFSQLVNVICRRLCDFKSAEDGYAVVMALGAMRTITERKWHNFDSSDAPPHLMKLALPQLKSLRTKSLSILVASAGSLLPDGPLRREVLQGVREAYVSTRNGDADIRSMGAMLRSLSVLGVKDIPLAWCIGDNLTAALNVTTMAMKALSEPDTRFAVKAMWAMATMGVFHRNAMLALGKYLLSLAGQPLQSLRPMDIAALSWTMCETGLVSARLLSKLQRTLEPQLDTSISPDLLGVLRGVTSLPLRCHEHPLEMEAFMLRCGEGLCERYNSGQLTKWGLVSGSIMFARARVFPQKYFETLHTVVCELVRTARNNGGRLAMDFTTSVPVAKSDNEYSSNYTNVMASEVMFTALHVTHLAVKHFAPFVYLAFPDDVAEFIARSFKSDLSHSSLQSDVVAALKRLHEAGDPAIAKLGAFHTEYEMQGECRFVLDVAWPEMKVCLEVDGPQHFVSPSLAANCKLLDSCHAFNSSHEGVGGNATERLAASDYVRIPADELKTAILNKLGWKVLSVPCMEWNSVKHNPSLQADYLRQKLAEK